MEAYVPSTPFFDTSSSDEKSQDSEFIHDSPPKHSRVRPRRQSRHAWNYSDDSATPTPKKRGRGRPRKNVPINDDSEEALSPNNKNHPEEAAAESNKGKHEEYLNAHALIISGRFSGLVGRIDRIVVSGWIYIADNDAIDRPVRWSEIKILDEEEYETWKSEQADKSKANKKVKGGSLCNAHGCGKYQQSYCNGFCIKHHKAYLNGDIDNDGNEVESGSPSKEPSQEQVSKEPDLIGAKIRLTHPSYAGTTGIIINKHTGLRLNIKWQSSANNNTPGTTQLFEDVNVSDMPPDHKFSTNPAMRYSGAIVEKDGVTGRVEKVIKGDESYTTDCTGTEKTFLRSEFIVLNYGDGTISKGRLKDDGDDESHEIDEYSTESVDSENADEIVQNVEHEEDDEDYPDPSFNSPLIGATVFMVSGKYKGKMGKVTDMCRRGWWGVDGIASKVQTSQFKIVDDGFINIASIKDFFRDRITRGRPIPSMEKLDEIYSKFNADLANASDEEKTRIKVKSGKYEDLESGNNKKSIFSEKVGDVHIGVTVRLKRGNKHAGYTGKITNVYHGGWWQIDGLDSKVQARHVDFIDDGHLDMNALKIYYSTGYNGTEMPKVVRNTPENSDGESSSNGHMPSRRAMHRQKRKSCSGSFKSTPTISTELNKCFKYKISGTDFRGAKARQTGETESIVKWHPKPATHLHVPTIPKLNTTQHTWRNRTPVLDPFLIQPSEHFDKIDSKDIEKKQSLKLVPKGLRHLSPETFVEIFNRRTGRVMRGDEAIALKDLPAALLDHAEYEPIVPSGNIE
eukprot:scaffold2028_cov74-Cyclotella_meneghiniana.AAC.6